MKTLAVFSMEGGLLHRDGNPLPIDDQHWHSERIQGRSRDKLLIIRQVGDSIKRFGLVVPKGHSFPEEMVFFKEGCVATFPLSLPDGVRFTVDAGSD